MSANAVVVTVDGGVATVRLSRPAARNAWDDTLGDGMAAAFSGLAARPDVRVVLLAGEGMVFCAGLMPDVGATALLATLVGPAKAAELLMLADPLDAAMCERLGLVSRLADDEKVLTESADVARRLAAGPTLAHSMTKKALRAWAWRGMADQMELEASLQQTLVRSADWAEGRAAFLERRDARFTGR